MADDAKAKQSGKKRAASPGADDIGRISVLDILRVLGGVVLLSAVASYFITGDSLLWGWRPWFARTDGLKAWMKGPLSLTDDELKAYDGSDPSKPILLALNGTIYDVSAGASFYGPGGGYHFFAGRDAARAFVTGCFEEDLTPDLRGVEMMYIPVDNDMAVEEEAREKEIPKAEVKVRRQQDAREARKRVKAVIEGWSKVFAGETGKDYLEVGRVRREEGWLEKLPKRELCEKARMERPKMRKPKKQQ